MNNMSQGTNYAEIAETLTMSLGLRQSPIAISLTDSIPDGVQNHAGRVPAGCRFWENATAAVFATSAIDHETMRNRSPYSSFAVNPRATNGPEGHLEGIWPA